MKIWPNLTSGLIAKLRTTAKPDMPRPVPTVRNSGRICFTIMPTATRVGGIKRSSSSNNICTTENNRARQTS